MSSPAGSRVGRPAPAGLVAAYFVVGLVCWLAAAIILALAAPELARGGLASPEVLLAVHLLALGFLPLAVTGGVLHVLPTLLRNDVSSWRGPLALPLLCAGPALAVGIAQGLEPLVWSAAAVETAGFALIAWEVAALALQAPRDRMLLASRTGVLLSTLNAGAALVFGAALAGREGRPFLGIPHDRAIAVHLHLAALGWLTLLLLTVGRTLGPMLALAPAAPRRRFPIEELALTAGVWLLVAGVALGERPLAAAGGLLVLGTIGVFAALIARVAREHRRDVPEGPLLHFAAGLFFLAQAAVLGLGMLFGTDVTARRLAAYVLALLLGWAAGATVGHVGKLLSLSAWTWWPPGPRPKQGDLYARRLWIAEAIAFAAGVELAIDGTLAGSTHVVAGGAVLLVGAALLACAGAALTLRSGRPALRLLGVYG